MLKPQDQVNKIETFQMQSSEPLIVDHTLSLYLDEEMLLRRVSETLSGQKSILLTHLSVNAR